MLIHLHKQATTTPLHLLATAAILCCILNRDTQPDVARDGFAVVPLSDMVAHERTALGQHLIDVPVRMFHGVEHLVDVCALDVLVEEVAHRVHENHPRLLPKHWLPQPRRPKRQIEALLIGVPRNAAPTFCETLGLAIVASRTDFGAARHRVPRRVRPFDVRLLGQLLAS